jgi:catechol 2,3-dioxygenase-like lactoylglutathione lyase family enzyme
MALAAAALAFACGADEEKTRTRAGGRTDRAGAVGLAIVGIITADINRSLRFYRQLGLDVPESVDAQSYRLRAADGHVFFWETPAVITSFDPTWTPPPPGDRRVVLEFGFDDPDSLDETFRRLLDGGAPSRLAPFEQGGGVRYAMVVDPDGNQVSLRYPAS